MICGRSRKKAAAIRCEKDRTLKKKMEEYSYFQYLPVSFILPVSIRCNLVQKMYTITIYRYLSLSYFLLMSMNLRTIGKFLFPSTGSSLHLIILPQETRDKDFLWNRVVQLAALAEGHHLDLEVWQKEKRHG